MNKRGQVFSLDFLLAVSMIVLAIGLSINYFEVNQLNQKEIENQNELWNVANTAMDMLLTRSDTATDTYYMCRLRNSAGSTTLDFLPNCIPKGIIPDKIKLGLYTVPEKYKCKFTNISETTINFHGNINGGKDCNVDFTANPIPQNYVSVQRKIIVLTNNSDSNSRDISKGELLNCQKNAANPCTWATGGGGSLKESTIQLTVWKNE